MRERDIKHENGRYWVGDTRDSYTVYCVHPLLASYPDSSYAHDEDGLSIAVARCNYLAERARAKRAQAETADYIDQLNERQRP